MFHLIKLLLDFLAGGLGQKAHHHDGHKAEHEPGDQLVNLEDFGREAREVELPHEGGDAAHQHADDGGGEGGTLPEEGEQHDRPEGSAKAAPGKTHEAHHHVEETLAVLHSVAAGSALHGHDDGDNGDKHHHAAADPHDFFVRGVLAEQVLVKVVTEGRSGNKQLGVGGTHDGGKDGGHQDGGNGRVAENLAEDHENAFRVVHLDAVGFYIVAAKKGDHDDGSQADGDPGHGNTAGMLDFFGFLDRHKTHQNVGHAKVAKAPGQARNQGDKADGLAGGGVGE